MERFAKASVRDISRPAPCGAEKFQSALPRPRARMDPARMLRGMSTSSPLWAAMAPLRRIISSVSM